VISLKVVSNYLNVLRVGGWTFAFSARQKICGILSNLPHRGQLRG
jgi:hypothetical protein